MPDRFQPYRKELTARARALRRNMPAPEAKLWYGYLRSLPCAVTRQKPLGKFIVDFYCARHQLAIEIDGDSHFTPEAIQFDMNRTATLAMQGIRVLRFTNEEVVRNFDGVCLRIGEALGIGGNPPARPRCGRVGPL